jgi:3-isopropylmalate/(R)-2-methylmalate dehydratase small subunit
MSGWSRIEGRAVALAQANVDTDQLIPARFMSQPRSAGYGDFLLHDARQENEGHVLNRNPEAEVLVTRRNFGSGSSREAAVYALADFGIRAIFAPSFGDIFASNAVNNGLLPARLEESEIEELIAALQEGSGAAEVDLAAGTARICGIDLSFDLDPVWREKLVKGWDDIDLTERHAQAIRDFKAERLTAHPWAQPTS